MSNIIKLLAVSLLLVGCKGTYDKNTDPKKVSKPNISGIEKHPARHVNGVARSAAERASTVTTMWNNRPNK